MCEGVQTQVWKGQRSFLHSIFLWIKNKETERITKPEGLLDYWLLNALEQPGFRK